MSGRPYRYVEISVLYYVGVELAVIRAAYAAVVARAYRVAFLFVLVIVRYVHRREKSRWTNRCIPCPALPNTRPCGTFPCAVERVVEILYR